jgi:hypothetical protein
MPSPSVRVWSLAAVAAVAACGERPPSLRAPGVNAAVDAGPDASPPSPPLPAAEAPRVAPHPGQITAVVVERAGTAAVTIDHLGDVRLWPSLDGTQPPVALPFHGALALDVARTPGWLAVGAIDPSGAAHLYRFSAVGGLIDVVDVPAVPQAVGLVAVADGWLVVRADQSIIRVGADGVASAPLERDGHRIEAITRSASGAAYALLSRGAADQRLAVVVTVVVGRDGLRWGREVALPTPPAVPAELVVSPDDRLVAYLTPPTSTPIAAGRTSASAGLLLDFEAPPPTASRTAWVRLVALAGGDQTPALLVDRVLDDPRRLLFLAPDRLALYTASGDSVVTLGAKPAIALADRHLGVTPALGGGVLVWPAANALAVARGDDEPRYLGFQSAGAHAVALSPDGGQALWAAGPRRLVVEDLAGTAAPRTVPIDGVATALAYLDADHALVVTGSELWVFELARGAVVGRAPAPSGAHGMRFHAGTGWLVGNAAGGAWALRIAPGSPPTLGVPAVIADGSHQAWPLDAATAAEPVLATVESGFRVRTYRADQLAPGAVAATTPTAEIAMVGLIATDGTRLDRDGAVIPRRPLAASPPPAGPAASRPGPRLRPPSDLAAPPSFRPGAARLFALPGTDDLVVVDPAGGVSRRARDGAVAWTADLRGGASDGSVSADGRRLALAGLLGGLVLDLATGEILALRCGWAYGAWPTPPEAAMTSVHSICE